MRPAPSPTPRVVLGRGRTVARLRAALDRL